MVDKQHVFKNTLINKSKLKDLMYNAFKNYGIVKSSIDEYNSNNTKLLNVDEMKELLMALPHIKEAINN